MTCFGLIQWKHQTKNKPLQVGRQTMRLLLTGFSQRCVCWCLGLRRVNSCSTTRALVYWYSSRSFRAWALVCLLACQRRYRCVSCAKLGKARQRQPCSSFSDSNSLPAQGSAIEQRLGAISHAAMYGFMLAMPITGVVMGYFGGKGLPFFFTTIPGAQGENKVK